MNAEGEENKPEHWKTDFDTPQINSLQKSQKAGFRICICEKLCRIVTGTVCKKKDIRNGAEQ